MVWGTMFYTFTIEACMGIEPVVRGLVEGLLVDDQHTVAVDHTAAVLVRQIHGMPGLMRFGMCVLLLVFDLYGVLRCGRRFRNQSIAAKRCRITEWSKAPIGPCRDMVEFHRKMGTFVALSLEYEGLHS
jgi:hypothetical protein